jgi:hypothetical protein
MIVPGWSRVSSAIFSIEGISRSGLAGRVEIYHALSMVEDQARHVE